MKKMLLALIFLASLVLLSGCIESQDSKDDTFSQPNATRGTQYTSNTDSEQDLLEEELLNCLSEKAECENQPNLNCPDCKETTCPDCPSCPALTDCGSVATALGNQLTECSAEKNSLENTLADCSNEKSVCIDEKNACNAELDLANIELQKVLKITINHYVKGNLYVSGDYRLTQAFTSENNEKIIVGLEYEGGDDDFFNPGVMSGLIRWYVLTRNVSGSYDPKIVKSVYESDAGDTVIIGKEPTNPEVDYLKIKSAEFDAATSKEGLAIKKIIVMYTYKNNP